MLKSVKNFILSILTKMTSNDNNRDSRSFSFKCALHSRDREIASMEDFHLLKEKSFCQKMIHVLAKVLPEQRDRKFFEDTRNGKCFAVFPFFILSVTIIEFAFFVYYYITNSQAGSGSVPIDSTFIYRPDKKHEFWRFIFYMLLHAGWFHISFNLIMQVLVGIPLEMVHGSVRIGCIYLAGVLAGSLGTSILDPSVFLVGASGGVYALLAAHLANIMLNYNNMNYGIVRFLAILIFASCDVGFAIYSRYESDSMSYVPPVSFVAHLCGALSGLTIGLVVLKNFEQKLFEQMLWWVALGIYLACVIFAILFNVINSVNITKMREESIRTTHHHNNY